MALVVLGLFVLVWIISAVVKASQDTGPKRQPGGRPRPADAPRVERTSNSDIDRFMAEIDRLRRKGEGMPSGRPADSQRPAQRPIIERPRSLEPSRPRPPEPRRERDRERERRPRQTTRPLPAPPPALPRTEPVPVLRPVKPEPPAPPPAAPAKPARPAKPAPASVPVAPVSPVAQTLQTLLRSPQGPAAALILAEVFGEPRGRRPMRSRGR